MKKNEIDLSTITVGLVQMACSPDADKNLKCAMDSIRAAAKKGAQIRSKYETRKDKCQ